MQSGMHVWQGPWRPVVRVEAVPSSWCRACCVRRQLWLVVVLVQYCWQHQSQACELLQLGLLQLNGRRRVM